MSKNNIYGSFLVLIGIILLLRFLDIVSFNIFFDGWWTLLIIIPSFLDLFKKGNLISSVLGLSIGVLLLLACQNFINWESVGQIFLPILLITIGFSLIFKTKIKKENKTNKYFSLFSGCEEKVKGELKTTFIASLFGGIDLDLKNAEIKKDIEINVLTIFGGADIKLPSNVNVETKGLPIFGGIENKYKGKGTYTVRVNYVSVFGGVDLL